MFKWRPLGQGDVGETLYTRKNPSRPLSRQQIASGEYVVCNRDCGNTTAYPKGEARCITYVAGRAAEGCDLDDAPTRGAPRQYGRGPPPSQQISKRRPYGASVRTDNNDSFVVYSDESEEEASDDGSASRSRSRSGSRGRGSPTAASATPTSRDPGRTAGSGARRVALTTVAGPSAAAAAAAPAAAAVALRPSDSYTAKRDALIALVESGGRPPPMRQARYRRDEDEDESESESESEGDGEADGEGSDEGEDDDEGEGGAARREPPKRRKAAAVEGERASPSGATSIIDAVERANAVARAAEQTAQRAAEAAARAAEAARVANAAAQQAARHLDELTAKADRARTGGGAR